MKTFFKYFLRGFAAFAILFAGWYEPIPDITENGFDADRQALNDDLSVIGADLKKACTDYRYRK